LRGDKLIVDLTNGTSRVESNSGRVQGVFQSSGAGQGGGPTSIIPGGKK
jgi:lipopolysaccharide export system protein LptA